MIEKILYFYKNIAMKTFYTICTIENHIQLKEKTYIMSLHLDFIRSFHLQSSIRYNLIQPKTTIYTKSPLRNL